jgi:hypothetical protein
VLAASVLLGYCFAVLCRTCQRSSIAPLQLHFKAAQLWQHTLPHYELDLPRGRHRLQPAATPVQECGRSTGAGRRDSWHGRGKEACKANISSRRAFTLKPWAVRGHALLI